MMPEISPMRSVDLLIEKVKDDKSLIDRLKVDPIATLQAAGDAIKREHPPVRAPEDKFTYRLAVVALSVVVLLVIFGVGAKWILTTGTEFKVPEVLVAMGSTALGALAGLLMPGGGAAR